MTITAAICIWILAGIFSIPALYGSHIKVSVALIMLLNLDVDCARFVYKRLPRPSRTYVTAAFRQTLVINSNTSFSFCYPFPEDWPGYAKSVVMGRFLLYYTVPLFIIGCFYVLIARHLVSARVPGETQGTMRQVGGAYAHIYYILRCSWKQ